MARVLFAINVYPDGGGIASILENYVTELRSVHDIHVAIVETRPGAADRLRLPADRLHSLGYTNAINPILMPTSLAYTARVGAWLRRLVRRLNPAVIVTQDALNLPVPALVATTKTGTRLAVMDHGTLTNVHDEEWLPMLVDRLGPVKGALFRMGFVADAPWRALRWRLGVRFADELWFTGSELAPWFSRAGARARRYAQTVPADFTPASPSERAAARDALGVAKGTTLFNYVGRLDGEKGLDTIVAGLRDLPRDADWSALVAGDGSLAGWLEREVSAAGLEDRVRLLGRLDRTQVRLLQQASDFHLYAGTFSCGVSICLLEAMATGVVPIVSDVPALQRELVENSGWVFHAGDAEAFGVVLRDALATPPNVRARRRELTLAAVHRASAPTVPELLDLVIDRGLR